MKTQALIMVVDDDPSMGELLSEQLEEHGYGTVVCQNAMQARAALERRLPDAIVTDIKMPGEDGLSLCRDISTTHPDVPVLVMTAFGNMERAIEAMRAGAFDFLPKPFRFDLFEYSLRRALRLSQLEEEVQTLKRHTTATILGESAAIARVRERIARVAAIDVSVVIRGESGVGKELVSRAIHDRSARRDQPYVTVNCAALPAELLESELFGHVRGAFTGAASSRLGLFRRADKGTLLLDEIGDMPASLQPKLLRVLEERRVRPLGSDREIPVDVRILSATHQNLEEAVALGSFRQDLWYRLGVVELEVPPLRSRGPDILLLAHHFLAQAHASQQCAQEKRLSPGAARAFLEHDWPGNIRELKNCISAAVALCPRDVITPEDLPIRLQASQLETPRTCENAQEIMTLEEVANRHILHVLDSVDGNKSRAARLLGIDRKTLYMKLEKLESPP